MYHCRHLVNVVGRTHALGALSKRTVMISSISLQKKATDPVQQLFLDKIHEYTKKQQAAGGVLVDATPEVEKSYKDELDRVARMFQITGDATKFPEFKFEEPKLDPIFLTPAEDETAKLKNI